jgi:methylmalonyl-CoA/ethylmalonyl-CoA epimerase
VSAESVGDWRLHHVAHVVRDLDVAIEELAPLWGLELEIREHLPPQGVEAAMLRRDDVRVELIAPTDPESGVARFLDSRGPGFHHVAYSVEDIGRALAELRDKDAELIDDQPRPGLGGHLVAFVHPRSGGGVLTELVQD